MDTIPTQHFQLPAQRRTFLIPAGATPALRRHRHAFLVR